MTISGREEDSSNVDYQFNDPHILPVHLYRAPPPSYSELSGTKQQIRTQRNNLQSRNNTAMTNDSATPTQHTDLPETPPPYENIQPRAN